MFDNNTASSLNVQNMYTDENTENTLKVRSIFNHSNSLLV